MQILDEDLATPIDGTGDGKTANGARENYAKVAPSRVVLAAEGYPETAKKGVPSPS